MNLQSLSRSFKKNNEVFEAGQKLEAMREKKFQQEHERWQKWQEEREVELEMKEVEREKWEEQRARRKREQEQVEEKLKWFEEQRRAKEEEEAKRQQEEAERLLQKRKGDEQGQGSFRVTSLINAVNLAAANRTKTQVKSRKEVIAEKAPPLNITVDTPTEELINMVGILREKLRTVHGEIFDLKRKTEKQDYHIHELDQRINDMNQTSFKPRPVITIGSGIVSKMRDRGLESLQKDASFTPKSKESALKVNVGVGERMNQLQAQMEADVKKEPKKITVKPTYQMGEAILSGKDKDNRKEYEAQKEARRKKHEQEEAELNRIKEEYQKKKAMEVNAVREARKKETEKNNNNVTNRNGTKAPVSQKELEINKRVPALEITPSSSEEELREAAADLINLLKDVFGDIFDLQMVKQALDKQYAELDKEVQNEPKAPTLFIPVEGKVKQRKEEAWNRSKMDTSRSSSGSKKIIKEGSVKNRLAMFENGRN
ncbi:uncharacterized protein [Apostichopus japonicus]|uniref:uncharacterized protein isoform X3 n=1 Tax=Stichopus japonicus TaxID=307972 RepID=UPI003AB8A173